MRYRRKKKSKALALLLALGILALCVVLAFVGYRITIRKSYPLAYEELIYRYAQEYDLQPSLVAGVIHRESRFDPQAVSRADARGLMQVMPETGEWIANKLGIEDYSVEMLFDPEINIQMGCWYLRFLMDRFDGNIETVLAAYNAGHGRVSDWLEDSQYSSDGNLTNIPIEETRTYVEKVLDAKEKYEELYHIDENQP